MSANETVFIGADGEREFPCRCGQTHGGPYGQYDWAQHNCFHDERLQEIAPDEIPGYLMCPDCGKTFWIEKRGSA